MYQGKPVSFWMNRPFESRYFGRPQVPDLGEPALRSLGSNAPIALLGMAGTPLQRWRFIVGQMARVPQLDYLHLPAQLYKHEISIWGFHLLGSEAKAGRARLDPVAPSARFRCPRHRRPLPGRHWTRGCGGRARPHRAVTLGSARQPGGRQPCAEPRLRPWAASGREPKPPFRTWLIGPMRSPSWPGSRSGGLPSSPCWTGSETRAIPSAGYARPNSCGGWGPTPNRPSPGCWLRRSTPTTAFGCRPSTCWATCTCGPSYACPGSALSLQSTNTEVRARALRALRAFGSSAKPAIAEVIGCCRDREIWVREEATNTWLAIDPRRRCAARSQPTPAMILLPLVERELRVGSRHWTTYWKRVSFAFVAILVGVFAFLCNSDSPSYRLSGDLFGTLVCLATFYCLGFGLFSAADCLSHEKREGTLGLLFLTDLKSYDIVLGKLVTSSISGCYATLALCPILAVPLMLGGVTGGDVWRVALTLANTLLFSLAVGVFVSTLSVNPRKAMGGTLLLLLTFGALLPATAGIILMFIPLHRSFIVETLLWACPFYTMAQASDDLYRVAKHHEFWWSLGLTHALAWLFLVGASWLVPHCWQDRPVDARRARWRERRRNWVYGHPARRKALPHASAEGQCLLLAGRPSLEQTGLGVDHPGVGRCPVGLGLPQPGQASGSTKASIIPPPSS